MSNPAPAKGHMPFKGHRTQAEVREDKERRSRRSREAADPAKQSRDQLPWCPQEYRCEYQQLRNGKKLGATEARRIIHLQIEADKRRCASFVPIGDWPLLCAETAR